MRFEIRTRDNLKGCVNVYLVSVGGVTVVELWEELHVWVFVWGSGAVNRMT